MEVHCNYCNWVGNQPSPAEFQTEEEFQEALKGFMDSHDEAECERQRDTEAAHA